jgi:type I restriction enzyme S subunit
MIWVTPTDIKSLITTETAKKLSVKGQNVARIVLPNTILVTCIASIGKNTMVLTSASFNQQINALVPYEANNPYFLLTQSELWSQKMIGIIAATTMQIVNKTEFELIETMVPNKDEQTAIGNFFRNLDDLITLYQQELVKLQNIKAACLNKMFV